MDWLVRPLSRGVQRGVTVREGSHRGAPHQVSLCRQDAVVFEPTRSLDRVEPARQQGRAGSTGQWLGDAEMQGSVR